VGILCFPCFPAPDKLIPFHRPYFDDANAIIFLAPISCFDEQLAEDHTVNRLEDTLMLWKAICSSPWLAKATLILLLNKCDLLEKKLAAGVQVKEFLPSFGDRANEASVVVKCKFGREISGGVYC